MIQIVWTSYWRYKSGNEKCSNLAFGSEKVAIEFCERYVKENPDVESYRIREISILYGRQSLKGRRH